MKSEVNAGMPLGSMYCNPYCNPSAKGSVEALGVILALTLYTADEVLPGLRLILLSVHVPVVPGLPGLGRLEDHLISSK